MALTAGAFGVIGGVTVVVLTLTATTSAPAYAVTQNPDGTVAITIHDLVGIGGANAELAKVEGARVGLRIGLVRGPAPSCLSMGHSIGVPGPGGPSRRNSVPDTPGH